MEDQAPYGDEAPKDFAAAIEAQILRAKAEIASLEAEKKQLEADELMTKADSMEGVEPEAEG